MIGRCESCTTFIISLIELQAFSKTVENALINLNLQEKESLVIHILGASNVENEVNWNPLCEKYHASLVLIGPNLDLSLGDESCVTRVKSLYGREALRLALEKTNHISFRQILSLVTILTFT